MQEIPREIRSRVENDYTDLSARAREFRKYFERRIAENSGEASDLMNSKNYWAIVEVMSDLSPQKALDLYNQSNNSSILRAKNIASTYLFRAVTRTSKQDLSELALVLNRCGRHVPTPTRLDRQGKGYKGRAQKGKP